MATVLNDISLGPGLIEEQARMIYAQGGEAVVFTVLSLAKMLAEQRAAAAATPHQTPVTPSGMQPPCRKPTADCGK